MNHSSVNNPIMRSIEVPDDRTLSINRIIASHAAGRTVSPLEASNDILPNLPNDFADTMIDDLEKKIRAAWDYDGIEIDDNRRRALEILLPKAHNALEERRIGPLKPISIVNYSIVESVIMGNGTRPSLLVEEDNQVPSNHPMAGDYADDIERNFDHITKICQATGRLQPDNRGGARRSFGTAVLANTNGLVLTNLHVANLILNQPTTQRDEKNGAWRILSGVAIDFAGWTQSRRKILFPIKEIRPLDVVKEPGFSTLDIAVMQLGDPMEQDTQLPEPLSFKVDIDAEDGTLAAACVVGFPGHPIEGSSLEITQTEALIELVFGNKFGLKRFAPGTVSLPLGEVEDDLMPWVIGHDMSTFNGSSGSCLCNFTGEAYAFGIHFGGINPDKRRANYAHALSPDQVKEALANMGIELT